MLRYQVPAVSITGQHGRIWTSKPPQGQSGIVAVLQVPASKFSEAVRSPDFTVAAMERRADLLVTADTRGYVYMFDIRHNRFSCLDKAGCAGTAALVHGPRSVFVAFADGSIRCYDASKGSVVGVLREHRSPVRHMEVNRELNELVSTSVDGVLVWDLKKLRRKRVLGSGPYGALQASYTADGLAVVTHFKDGSFYVWSAGNFSLVRSFTLPVAPTLRPAQASFALSPDGQLLVSCGPTLPVLLVYSVIGGTLRYGVGLPAAPSQLDADVGAAAAAAAGGGKAAAAATEAAAAAAEAAAAGAAVLPPPGMEPRSQAAAALAAKLPMAVGAQQVVFLSDSATVAVMLTDGSLAFVDVLSCSFVGIVPYSFPERPDGSFSMDARAQHMALTANGKVFLYDLAGRSSCVQPPRPLSRLLPSHLDDLAAAVALEHLRRQREKEQERGGEAGRQDQPSAPAAEGVGALTSDTQQLPDKRNPAAATSAAAAAWAKPPSAGGFGPAAGRALQQGSWGAAAAAAAPAALSGRRGNAVATARQQAAAVRTAVHPNAIGGPAPAAARPAAAAGSGGGGGVVKPEPAAGSLNRTRLEALLEAFGEYPAKYRLMIWDFLLQLPHNTAAFGSLAGLGLHPAFKDMHAKLPLANRALAQRLAATLSQLAHWCPVFAESTFLPDLVFPFVKLFASAPGLHGTAGGGGRSVSAAALDERCFETLATLLACGWMRSWWERFPHPPLGLLTRLQDLVALHDAPLAAHFGTYRGGLPGVVWPHLATLWTELLTRSDWLRLWDHCVTVGPDLLYFFVAAYLVSLRGPLMAMDTDHKLANWMAGPPPIDMGDVLRVAYLLRSRTPEELRPVPGEWQPLPQGITYVEFKGFPAGAVELFAADRARIREAEDAIMRRRAVVSELEMRTRAVALQAASLSSERQQLAALEEERRAMLRQLEADTATEMARLDDRAKEEKLKQIAAVEKAYQANLLEVRATWQRELEFARAELAHKRAMAAQQIRSREEDEQIMSLEFHAQQRMRELEEDVRRAAVTSAVRDELLAHQMETEAKQRLKMKEWETDDEARKQRMQHEAERRAALAQAAEEGAARSAAMLEAQAVVLHIEDEVVKVDGARRLRRLAEDAALVTAEARAAEEARLAARAEAEKAAMRLRAKADVAWYEAEQMRREQMLEQERQQMEAAAAAARRKLSDTEAAARTMAAQAELLERRRLLERQNAAEEAQVLQLVGAMAVERGRDAVLVSDLEAKEDEMKAKLEYHSRLGSLQREVESSEAAAAVALMAALDEQQRKELLQLRRLHDAALERLSKDLEGQVAEAAKQRRAELRSEQVEAVRALQAAFERRKQDLDRELLREQGRRLRQAAGVDQPPRQEPPAPTPASGEQHPPPPSQPRADPERSSAAPQHSQPPPPQRGRDLFGRNAAAGAAGGDDDADPPFARPAAARPAFVVVADAARHADHLLRVLEVGSETSAAPTLTATTSNPTTATAAAAATDSDSTSASAAAAAALRAVASAAAEVFTPRRRSFDFLSDSNMTPASFISSVTNSAAPSPESAVAGPQPLMAAIEAAMAGAPNRTATAAARPQQPPQSQPHQQREDTQGSMVGVWPQQQPARPTRQQPAANPPPAATATATVTAPTTTTTSSSLISGTASSDTVPANLRDSLGGAAAAAPASGGLSYVASRGWQWRPMSPLRPTGGLLANELATPSTSSPSWQPTSTGHTGGGASISASASTSRVDSSARAPALGPLEQHTDGPAMAAASAMHRAAVAVEHSAGASVAAASAMQRAALAVARAVSPERPLPPQDHQQLSPGAPSTVTGSSSHTPSSGMDSDLRAMLGLDERGRPVRIGASGDDRSGTSDSSSPFPGSSAILGSGLQQQRGPPLPGSAATAAAAAAAAARSAVLQAATAAGPLSLSLSQQQRPDAAQPWDGARSPGGASVNDPIGRTNQTSPSDSWTSLQRSGLLGLSQPLGSLAQAQAHSRGQGPAAASRYDASRYDTPSVGPSGAAGASGGGGFDAPSTTTGMTSLTSISTFTSHISFTPATRDSHSTQQQQSQQRPQPQQRSRLHQQQPSPGATPLSSNTDTTTTGSGPSYATDSSVSAAALAAEIAAGARLAGAAAAAAAAAALPAAVAAGAGGGTSGTGAGGGTSGTGTGGFSSGTSLPSWPPPEGWLDNLRELVDRAITPSTTTATTTTTDTTTSGTRDRSSPTYSPSGSPRSRSGAAPFGLSVPTAPGPTASNRSGPGPGESSGGSSGATGSSPRGGEDAAAAGSSSSAGFQSLRDSSSNSAVLLGSLARGAAAAAAAGNARGGGAGGNGAPFSSSSAFSSSPSEAGAATAATASLRPALSGGAAMYGSSSSSGAGGGDGGNGGGTSYAAPARGGGTGVGTYAAHARGGTGSGSYAVAGGGTGTGSSSYEGRSSLTHSSTTAMTAGSTETGASSDAFLTGPEGLAALLARTSASIPATTASAASTEDVAEVLRLLRLSGKLDLSLRPAAAQPQAAGGPSGATTLGFGSRVASSTTSSMTGSEPGAPTLRGPESAAATAGGSAAAWHGAVTAAPAASDWTAASEANRPVWRSVNDDEDDDDASMVAVATPNRTARSSLLGPGTTAGRESLPATLHHGAARPSPGPSAAGGRESMLGEHGRGYYGDGGGGRSGGAAPMFDGAASDLFGSSPGGSTAAPFTAGYATTPGGVSDLSAALRSLGLAWGDGAAAGDSTTMTMTPTTVTDFTAYDEDGGPLTMATRATAGTRRREIDDEDDDVGFTPR